MLSVASYDRTYVELCRGRIAAAVEAYQAQVGGKAQPVFEHEFCKAMVMALDHYFDHRARGQEGKDGNALNEVRMLCNSFMQGDGELLTDSTIRYDPTKSALGLSIGHEIVLTAAGFARLAEAFFAEIEKRYP